MLKSSSAVKITAEQENALADLTALLRSRRVPEKPDALKTWLGISGEDVSHVVLGLLIRKEGLENQILNWTERRPVDAAFEFLAAAALAFFTAEKASNPKINSYIDAFYYIATCASVGYADVFAVTQTGRSIASLVMIVGPALTNRLLERPTGNK